MKLPVNTLKNLQHQYGWSGDVAPEGIEALATRIGAQLGGVEEVIDVGSKYVGIIVAKVVSCEKHPNADKLNVCWIDDGGKAQGVDRNTEGLVQVVCGAPNVRAGITVAWLPPGATVPESVGKDPFVLGARELRGVVSNGMLASQRELALGDNHDGILEVDDDVIAGTDFAEHYGLAGEVLLDIENKMFTHRPDCFGYIGLARELAGIQHQQFTSPDWYKADIDLPAIEADELPLTVRNEIPELVPRFTALTVCDVLVGPSPLWLQIELAKVGLRSINNIVDLTNYHMLLTGQPLHAYDYDKVAGLDKAKQATIVVRQPRPGEKITLLNGKEIEPRAEAIMIATDSRLIGVGGVMGGAETEVDETTRNIIIECANFDMYSIRRTSMAHGLFTDAVTRFNKGQSPLQTRAVLSRIVEDVRAIAGGKVAGQVVDSIHVAQEVLGREALHAPVTLAVEFINVRLGSQLDAAAIEQLLRNVEFTVQAEGDQLTVTAPFWRTDIEIAEDVVEEVGRLYGFDNLPLELPRRSLEPVTKPELIELKQQVREILSKAGANEVLTYSFVHGKLLEKAGQDPEDAFKLSNALSPDLQYYRLSLTPSLLDKVHPNVKAGYDQFALFEIGKGHDTQHANNDNGLPAEFEMLDLVVTANDKTKPVGAAFYNARVYLEQLAKALGISLAYEPLPAEHDHPVTKPYERSRSALVTTADGTILGMIGELRQEVLKNFKLPQHTAAFGLGLRELLAASAAAGNTYKPLSRFPKVEQDICLRVASETTYATLHKLVVEAIEAHKPVASDYTLTPIDIYQRKANDLRKQITFRLSITSHDKTLRDSEVAELLDRVTDAAHKELHATRV